MTGIERLRKEATRWSALYDIESHGLLKIADQIERETLPRPRFEDGEPVQFGDEVQHKEHGHTFEVDRIEVYSDGWFAVSKSNGVRDVARPGEPFKRPEPPDTWEQIEADIVNKINPCAYFGWLDKECGEGGGCPGHGPEKNCSKVRASDIVRRCKKLAGVE